MGDAGKTPGEELQEALRQGRALDVGAVNQLPDRELLDVFKTLLTEDPDPGCERLEGLIRREPGRIGDLAVEALGKWGGPGAASRLRALEQPHPGRSRLKTIRRALHFHEMQFGRLSDIPAPDPEPDMTASRTAFLSAPNVWGGRIWLFRELRPGGQQGRLAVLSVSDRRGVRDFGWQDPGEDAFQRYLQHLAEQGVRLAAVSFDYLRARLREIEQWNEKRGEDLPLNYHALRDWLDLDSLPDEIDFHPAGGLDSIIQTQEPPHPEEIRGLLELEETGEWMLPPDAFEEHRTALKEAGQSRLVLEGMSPEDRIRQIVGRVLQDYADGDEGRLWSRRLLDLACVLNETGRERWGRVAVLVGNQLGSTPRSPLAESFFWALGARTLGLGDGPSSGADDPQRGPSTGITPG